MSLMRGLLLPGILLHEFSHYLACLILGLRVTRVQWVGSDPHVEHAAPADFRTVIVALSPLIGNTLIGWFSWSQFLLAFANGSLIWAMVWLWIAVPCVVLAFPSHADVSNAMTGLRSAGRHAWHQKNWSLGISVLILVLPLYVLFGALLVIDVLWPLRLVALYPLLI